MDMIGKTAELRVIRVDRIGSGSIQPGEVIRANVWIANGTAVGATVSAASMGPSGQVRRGSSAVTIQPHSSAAVRLDIPVEVPQIRDDQFSTLVGIVATNRRSGSWMAQLWRDGNANDNVLRVSWAVDPSVYTVRVHVRDFYVRDDCDD
ncbi:MAG: hypothetical protein OEN22_02080, partial [Gammaproteobacteria bacterium]|nr:hypothetical protein [Gammaproteobacteria bacterium]